MFIKRLELKRYKRLYVSDIESLIYTPVSSLQVIIGKNGAGKSSLVKELIPNTSKNKEFEPDGYSKLEVIHNNNNYLLTYDGKYSFIYNGKELNQSGIKRVQDELIEMHFGINPNIHGLLLGIKNFTDMNVSERKKWFTEILTKIDYTLAFEYLDKIKDKIKEYKTLIKVTEHNIAKLEENKSKIDSFDKKKELLEAIRNIIDKLSKLYKPNYDLNNIDVKDKVRELETKTIILNNLISKYNKGELANIEDKKVFYKNKIAILNDELNDINSKLNKLSKFTLDDDEINYYKNKKKTIEDRLSTLSYLSDDINKLYYLTKQFNEVVADVNHTLNDIVIIDDFDLSKYNDIVKTHNQLEQDVAILRNELDNLYRELRKYIENKDNELVTCPKCNYSFKPGYSEEKVNKLNNRIDEVKKELTKLTKDLEESKKLYDIYNKNKEALLKLKELLPIEIFNLLRDKTNLFKDLGNLNNLINNLTVTLTTDVMDMIDEYKEINEKLELLTKLNSEKLKLLKDKRDELIERRTNLINKTDSYTKELRLIESYLQDKKEINHISKELKQIITYLYNIKNKKDELINNTIVRDMVSYLKELENEVVNELIEISGIKKEYETLLNKLNEYKDKYETAKELNDLLSPNKGYIAHTLIDSINSIIEAINSVINNIWDYELEILPCSIDEKDLTFRFPVRVKDRIIEDVSVGSSSMKEIINLAFKLVAMEILELTDYPLILDEFGRAMDIVHREKAYDYIDYLSKTKFKQIFLISHYESIFGRFVNADVVMLGEPIYSVESSEVIKIKKKRGLNKTT